MNINSLKALIWIASAGLSAGLVYYSYDFVTRRDEISKPRITREEAKEILDSAMIPEGPKLTLNDAREVERAFLELNWSGERPPEPVVAAPVETEPQAQVAVPMSDLLSVYMLMEDTLHPQRGTATISYKPAANVTIRTPDQTVELKVGDRLAEPHQYAKVKAITVENGITFTFDDSEREEEDVLPQEFDYEKFIHIVGRGEEPIEAPQVSIPRLERDVWRPERTTMTKENNFVIGTEDSIAFAEDYGGILAREVRHARHRDPRTGKYDGIELKHVEPGGRMAAHGAQSGDVIKSINGHPVTSTAEAITFVKNHQDEYTVWEVEVENKGKTRVVTYESNQED